MCATPRRAAMSLITRGHICPPKQVFCGCGPALRAAVGENRMPEDNGAKKGLGILEEIREDAKALPKVLKERAKEELEGVKAPEKTQLFRSIFRVKHDDTPRNRALSVLTNVFFHLHPAKINRDAVRYSYTWGMGGITFYLFIVLTFTGVLLMFYYHPTKIQAFRDILYLEHDVPFGKLLRNIPAWAALLRITAFCVRIFRVFLPGSYNGRPDFNGCVGAALRVRTLLLNPGGRL